jgi:hypothetical protein
LYLTAYIALPCLAVQDYFTFDGHTGLITPCLDGDSSSGSSSGGSSSLVCGQLQDMVTDPAELCSAAGEPWWGPGRQKTLNHEMHPSSGSGMALTLMGEAAAVLPCGAG